jgi:hypothetical protein
MSASLHKYFKGFIVISSLSRFSNLITPSLLSILNNLPVEPLSSPIIIIQRSPFNGCNGSK